MNDTAIDVPPFSEIAHGGRVIHFADQSFAKFLSRLAASSRALCAFQQADLRFQKYEVSKSVGCRRYLTAPMRVLVCLLCCWILNAQVPVPIQFSAPDQYGIDQGAYSLAAADLNGDHRPDLVFGSSSGTSVMINKGDGTFLPPMIYNPVPSPQGVAAFDVNRDGFPDLVVFTGTPATLCVLLNHGDGTFGQDTCIQTGVGAALGARGKTMAVGDFNGDGRLDVAVSYATYFGSAGNEIFVNEGDGTFQLLSSFTAPGNPTSCCGASYLNAADVNGDGLADIVTNNDYGSFSVLINLGNGVVSPATTYVTNETSRISYFFADLNGDGRTDVIWNEEYYAFDYSLNQGSGLFTLPPSLNFPGQYFYGATLAVGDFNNDGNVDVVALWNGGTISYPNTGNGVFGNANTQQQVPFGGGESTAVADFDGDGRLDIAVSAYSGFNSYILLLRNSTPVSTAGLSVTAIYPPERGNGGTTASSISIVGTDFPPGAVVKLIGPGPDLIPASSVESSAGNLITASFDLRNAVPGDYSLVLLDALGNVLFTKVTAFNVIQGGAPAIWTDVIGRNVMRAGAMQTFYLLVGNSGTIDADSTIVWLTFPSYVSWSAASSFQPSDSFQANGMTTLVYQIGGLIPADGVQVIAVNLTPTDDPQYAHRIINLQVSGGK